jgi:glycosyltransferase involved in cell wall biosynthesis
LETYRVAGFLQRATKAANEVHYLSATDRDESHKIGCASQDLVFYPGVDIQSEQYGKAGKNILFAGTLSWQPNEEGLAWFLKHVRPYMDQDMRVDIVGGNPPAALCALSEEDGCEVRWHGRVPSVTPFYQQTAVFVAPLLSGSGIKIKILNALGHGLPVVTTSVGIEGFPQGWGDAIQVADTPEQFAAAIHRLVADRDLWERARGAAQPYISKYFSGTDFARWCAALKKTEAA